VVYVVWSVDDKEQWKLFWFLKKELKKEFEMTNLGQLHYYLGIEITQHSKYKFLSQRKYIGKLLNKFVMAECNCLSIPMEQNSKLTSKEGNEFDDAI